MKLSKSIHGMLQKSYDNESEYILDREKTINKIIDAELTFTIASANSPFDEIIKVWCADIGEYQYTLKS